MVYMYQPYKDRRQLMQELRLAAVKAATVPFSPKSSSTPSSSPWNRSINSSATKLQYLPESPVNDLPSDQSFDSSSLLKSIPIETQLQRRDEKTCEEGGTAKVVPNNIYSHLRELAPEDRFGIIEEYHHHHHHHHHHYYSETPSHVLGTSTSTRSRSSSGRSRRASEVLEEVGQELQFGKFTESCQEDDSKLDEVQQSDGLERSRREDIYDASFQHSRSECCDQDEKLTELDQFKMFQARKENLASLLDQAKIDSCKFEKERDASLTFGQQLDVARSACVYEDIISRTNLQEILISQESIELSGYLHKSIGSGNSPKWKKQYFKLSAHSLMYLSDEMSAIPLMVLDLNSIEVDKDPEKLGKTLMANALLIKDHSNRKSLCVCSDSCKEMLKWYQAILNNALLLSIEEENRQKRTTRESIAAEDTKELNEKVTSSTVHKLTEFYPRFRKPPSYYDLLGVSPDASNSAIKRAFRKLAMDFHPDRNPEADPSEFAVINQAYETLLDPKSRYKYDSREKIKDVVRRGIDVILYLPIKMSYDEKTQRHYPSKLEKKHVLLFTDGELKSLYYQLRSKEVLDNEQEQVKLHPRSKQSFELRCIQRITFGRNDIVLASAFGSPPLAEERRLVLHGSKLKHDVYIEIDTPKACKEILEGLREIRCEQSSLFETNLEKWKERGYD